MSKKEETPARKRAPSTPTRAELVVMNKCDKLLLSLKTEEERTRTIQWLRQAHFPVQSWEALLIKEETADSSNAKPDEPSAARMPS